MSTNYRSFITPVCRRRKRETWESSIVISNPELRAGAKAKAVAGPVRRSRAAPSWQRPVMSVKGRLKRWLGGLGTVGVVAVVVLGGLEALAAIRGSVQTSAQAMSEAA